MFRHRFAFLTLAALAALLFSLSALLSGSVAANKIEVGPRAAWTSLNARASGALDAAWDDATGVPTFINGTTPLTRIPYTVKPSERGNPEAIARGFLAENSALFKLGPYDSFTLRRVEPDPQLHYAHVRLDQTYRSIPVYGSQLVVHLDPRENITAVNGHFIPDIDVSTVPLLTPHAAEELALQDLLDEQLTSAERASVKTNVLSAKTALNIYVDPDTLHSTLTWHVTIMTDFPLGQWAYFVNARRPVVTFRYDTATQDKYRETYSADNNTDIPGRLLISEGERSRDAVAQAAQDAAGRVYDYYFNNFKRDSIDGQGMKMVSTVHYGTSAEDAENAAWIGEYQQMIYGDGGRIFKPLSYGLDVVGHEFTHGITGATADLQYRSQSGALNESYSDVFGAMIDRGNWTIGETVVKSPPFPRPYLRDLQDPNMKGAYDPQDPLAGIGQPANVNQYANLPVSRKADNGGVHINSGIPNHAAFLISQNIGQDKTEQIYYRALTQYLTPTSNFSDAAKATMQAGVDLYGNAVTAGIQKGFADIGINVTGPSNVPAPPPTTTPSNNAPAPPSQQAPAGCTNLIQNGTFETDEVWRQVAGQNVSLIDTELPHTGKRSAWLGGQDKEAINYIYQDVTIPANATRVDLQYYRYLHEETSGLSGLFASDAKFSVAVADTNGTVIGTVEDLVSSQADEKWVAKQDDLAQLAGKTIRLAFTSENPRGNISSMFVDDVTLLSCTTGGGPGPSVPQAPADSVFVQGTITNSDTRRGVQGAQVFVMKPGVSATQAAADDQVTRSEVIATAVSDANGFYQTDVALPVGRAYSVIIIASGYRPIIADDGMNIPSNAANPFTINATLRSSR